MKISIHQPQYIPWLPYFLKIANSDSFIFLDSVDFQKNGVQNRNEIKTAQGRHWLTIPVSQNLGQKIKDTQINNNLNWKKKHWQSLKNCYGKSEFFSNYEPYLESFYKKDWKNLCDLNIELTRIMMGWLDIDVPTYKSSDIQSIGSGSDLILELCKNKGATKYISGMGGKNYLNIQAFESAGIEIHFMESELPISYPQLFPKIDFLNDLSAIDIIFNCGSEWKEKVIF
tara:strand:+ start:10272 stop:10955 length:684 start_codon:yes stop_codon:yes gene_type:complete